MKTREWKTRGLRIPYPNVSLQSTQHGGETAVNVDLPDDNAKVGDFEDVFSAARSDIETTRIRHRVVGAADEGVFPVGVALGVAVDAAAGELVWKKKTHGKV